MIFIEGKPDEVLVRALGVPRKEVKPVGDKFRVGKKLSKEQSAKGMIDQDPGTEQPEYLGRLQKKEERHGVQVFIDAKNKNKLIVLCPRLEEWLIFTTQSAGLKMADFGLSDKGNELHREINGRLQAVQKLIEKLLEVESDGMLFLKVQLLDEQK